MQRREALGKLGILTGGALLVAAGLLDGCKLSDQPRQLLTEKDVPLLDDIADTIIPATDTSPGAKAAKVGAYILAMVNDCWDETQQKDFVRGLDLLETGSKKEYGKNFMELSAAQKNAYLQQVDKEAVSARKNAGQSKEPYLLGLKRLVINGFVTSEIGATKALRYEAIPGAYHGCISYQKGDRPWATN